MDEQGGMQHLHRAAALGARRARPKVAFVGAARRRVAAEARHEACPCAEWRLRAHLLACRSQSSEEEKKPLIVYPVHTDPETARACSSQTAVPQRQ